MLVAALAVGLWLWLSPINGCQALPPYDDCERMFSLATERFVGQWLLIWAIGTLLITSVVVLARAKRGS